MSKNEPIPLYRDGRHYDEMIRSLGLADTPFYVEQAKHAHGPVLELACGTGRLTIPIAQAKLKSSASINPARCWTTPAPKPTPQV